MADDGFPSVSMVIIARDEEANIQACLRSFWSAVDEIVIVDTGSKDRTVEKAKAFARRRKQPGKLIIKPFAWTDDFAAARNYANSLATGEWIAWADADDELIGAQHLRRHARDAPEDVHAIMYDYIYAQDARGNTICTLKRERLLRGGAEWKGRVHEAQVLTGNVQMIAPEETYWRHRKPPGKPQHRNLRILEEWAKEEPENGRVLQYLGTERASVGRHGDAIDAYQAYLLLDGEPEEHRAQVWRKLAGSLLALERVDDAFQAGLKGLAENPSWPDCYLTLAQCSYLRGDHVKVVEWATEVVRRGMPNTLLIVNPLDYTVEPRVLLSGSLAELGRLDEAIACAEQALETVPDHPLLRPAYRGMVAHRKKHKTAETTLMYVDMLVAHDEQEKALRLLEGCVPYFATDHPGIVKKRSELRNRLAFASDPAEYVEHYVTNATQPENMVPDDDVTSLCELLPRVQFLKRHLTTMLEKEAA